MSDDDGKALVPRPSGELRRVGSGPGRLLSRVVGDALGFARATALQGARFRLGDFQFRERDYRQIQTWAECLGLSADEVLRRLEASTYEHPTGAVVRFLVADGAIRTLVIDPAEFVCPGGQLDLSAVPGLTKLYCAENQLTELDLSHVPELTELRCSSNQLTELDLSAVPGLTNLWCDENQLTNLDLSAVPGLTSLRCSSNQLTELDLSAVPGLTNLWCDENQLTNLARPIHTDAGLSPMLAG